jgi:hypothetical protein
MSLQHSGSTLPTPEKLAFTIAEVCTAIGISKTSIYELIAEGKLKSTELRDVASSFGPTWKRSSPPAGKVLSPSARMFDLQHKQTKTRPDSEG